MSTGSTEVLGKIVVVRDVSITSFDEKLQLQSTVLEPTPNVVSQASRIFPSGVRMRVNKFCVGGEGNIRLVTVARFSCRLPKIW